MIEDLLATAEAIATMDDRRPKQTSLRRAVSTAYYAVFHALARMCADEFVGVTRVNSDVWVRAYRAVAHTEGKRALAKPEVQALGPAIATFAVTFATLQEERHRADYDPRPFPHGRQATLAYIRQARSAVEALSTASADSRRTLASYVLLRSRNP